MSNPNPYFRYNYWEQHKETEEEIEFKEEEKKESHSLSVMLPSIIVGFIIWWLVIGQY
jgi:hypothetical protein